MLSQHKFKIDYTSLLSCYTADDIKCLIDDCKHLQQGHQLLYVIDTYDIVENYLPYIQTETFAKKDLNEQAQKFICYDHFFSSRNKSVTVLLDEYKIELLAAKNKLSRHLKNAGAVLNNLSILKEETNDFVNNLEKAEEFFKKHFEIILLFLIIGRKKDSILDEFFLFIKDRLNISELKALNVSDPGALTEVFTTSKSTERSNDLFRSYVEENKGQLLGLSDATKRYVYLENTFRDIQAIERVLIVNKSFLSKSLPYKLIYLSSANKTKEIFRVFHRSDPDAEDLNIHRNIYQYFLLDRVYAEYEKEPDKAIQLLESLYELLSRIAAEKDWSQATSEKIFKEEQVAGIVDLLFNERSNIIDNHFYLSIYEQYRNLFEADKITGNSPTSNNDVVKIIQLVDKNKEQYFNRLSDLDFSFSQLNQTYEILETYHSVEEYDPGYKYGKDIIRDPYHHVPYLLLLNGDLDNTLTASLQEFLNCICVTNLHDKRKLQSLLSTVLNQISRLDQQYINNRFLKSLLITYINFIAQWKDNATSIATLEDTIIRDLEKQYNIAKYQAAQLNLEKVQIHQQVDLSFRRNFFQVEIGYLLIWLYRRNDRITDSIALAQQLLDNDNKDPRILHGLGLSFTASVYDHIDKLSPDAAEINIKQALKYLTEAAVGFERTINATPFHFMKEIIIKNLMAISNLQADMMLRMIELSKDVNWAHINAARDHIEKIKILSPLNDLRYEENITYNCTEFEIEYYEAVWYHNASMKAMALTKVQNAKARMERIMGSPFYESFIVNYFQKKRIAIINLLKLINAN